MEGGEVAGHPNKRIREALKYAQQQGWTIRKSGGRGLLPVWARAVLDLGLFNAEEPRKPRA
ncbi:MAG: hypothetical protein ACODAD_07060, partial [Planctomycetota bacterium]